MSREKPMRKKPFLSALIFLSFLLILASFTAKKEYQIKSGPNSTAKNIIFMVPDGMGLANVTAARIFKHGSEGENLYLETLSTIGYQRTHSADSSMTMIKTANASPHLALQFWKLPKIRVSQPV